MIVTGLNLHEQEILVYLGKSQFASHEVLVSELLKFRKVHFYDSLHFDVFMKRDVLLLPSSGAIWIR